MSKIAIHLDHPLIDGEQITFRSPCASADATGLKIYTPTSYEDPTEVSAEYTLKDAGGTTVHGKTGLFATGAYVTVVLDTTNAIAYVHNAKTIYAADLQNNAATTAAGYALDARMGKTLQDQITSLNDTFQLEYVHGTLFGSNEAQSEHWINLKWYDRQYSLRFGNNGVAYRYFNGSTWVDIWTKPSTALMKLKSYTCTYSIGANETKTLLANDFSESAPTGYRPVAIANFDSGNNNVLVRGVWTTVSGEADMMKVRNITSSAISNITASVRVLYVRTADVENA